jgi:hypothetical protein
MVLLDGLTNLCPHFDYSTLCFAFALICTWRVCALWKPWSLNCIFCKHPKTSIAQIWMSQADLSSCKFPFPAACSDVRVFVFLCCCVLLTTQKHSGLLHVHTRADGEMNEMKARDGTKLSCLSWQWAPLAMTGMSLSGFSIAVWDVLLRW